MTLAIGVLAAVLTTSCWAPQLRRTLRRGTASDFAWPYLALLSVGLAGWFIYGILRDDLVIVVSNALVLGSVLVVISVKLRSRRLTFDQVELALPAGTDPVAALESLVDIGPRLAADLRNVGIPDAPALRTIGIDEANRRLVESGLQTGMHSRQAIQAAISGERGTAKTRKAGRRRRGRRTRPLHCESNT